MIECSKTGMYYANGQWVADDQNAAAKLAALGFEADREAARRGTIAWGILEKHNTSGSMDQLKLKFDAMASHDITFVGIVQTARASGLEKFPIPYVLTNCHNSLCAVGGTINEDDHMFGLSAAKKYGGIYVPPHMAVIHQYMREMQAGCGKMILGSDSHTRYGALGTMAIGEGGGELVKQLLGKTYDVARPGVVAVYLTGAPRPGVGPQDVALAIIGAVFANGYVKNKVMEFVGPGIANLELEYRNGIDVMTTETTCLSSIWCTDDKTRDYLALHGRGDQYAPLSPAPMAYYDGMVTVELDKVEPMIALPMHPSNVYSIRELNENLADILHHTQEECARLLDGKAPALDLVGKIENGRLRVDQGVIAGCAGGTYPNIAEAANILRGASCGAGEFSLSVYPASQPVMMHLMKTGALADLMAAGATVRTAFCGPCFGAGDVPANGSLSIRHTTRNFPNREGSKPANGQLAGVALMDARSIAATSRNGGILTAATELDYDPAIPAYAFDASSYRSRVYAGYGQPHADDALRFGPNIKDWPEQPALGDNLLLKVASFITDPVTTTDELIPSGETSSFRSNPLGLAEFTLSRKDPAYVGRAKAVHQLELSRRKGDAAGLEGILCTVRTIPGCEALRAEDVQIASTIYAVKPGDGSAREQAASCQRVLGAGANIAVEYATKRYRSNLINWGMLPFQLEGEPAFGLDDVIFVPGVRRALEEDARSLPAYVIRDGKAIAFTLTLAPLTADERQILLDGCLINFYKRG
ncbi:MAG TPA: hydratase [Candidatus Anaerofilum faecale]|nr:hydratase [Candidatus Anaerofilum faecale]